MSDASAMSNKGRKVIGRNESISKSPNICLQCAFLPALGSLNDKINNNEYFFANKIRLKQWLSVIHNKKSPRVHKNGTEKYAM